MPGGMVRSKPRSLEALVARFPRGALEFERRYEHDEHFRSVCQDYAETYEALARWRSSVGEDDRRTQDYVRLLNELESELLSLLQAAETPP